MIENLPLKLFAPIKKRSFAFEMNFSENFMDIEHEIM